MDPARPLFETDPGGGGEPAPSPEPAPEPAPEPQPEGGDQGGWTGPSQEEWQNLSTLADRLAPLADLAGEMNNGGQPGYGDPAGGQPQPQAMPDPTYDPEGFARWMDERDQRLRQEVSGEFEPIAQQVRESQTLGMIDAAIGSLPEEMLGLGLPEEHRELASDAILRMSASFYSKDAPLDQAMQQSGQYLGQLLSAAREQGRKDYIASLQPGGEGDQPPTEPSVAGSGVAGVPEPRSYEEIINRGLGGAVGAR